MKKMTKKVATPKKTKKATMPKAKKAVRSNTKTKTKY
tara:strand:- start:35 stop:145 length:111 start_codon:yes stop_codon:yes gene_type:complete